MRPVAVTERSLPRGASSELPEPAPPTLPTPPRPGHPGLARAREQGRRATEAAWDGVARAAAALAYRLREPGDGTGPRPPVEHGASLAPTGDERSRLVALARGPLGMDDYGAPPIRSDLYALQPLFPFAHSAPWDSPEGVFVGYDAHTGEPVRHSGRAWFSAGTSGSATLVLGSKYAGKSALLKSYLVRAVAEHGFRAWVYDTRAVNYVERVDGVEREVSEGEFCALVREAGGSVHRYSSGGPLRLNLLDPRLFGARDAGGREGLVRSVLQFLAGRRLTPQEGFALRVQLARLLAARPSGAPTVVDLREALLRAPADPSAVVPEEPTATEGELFAWGRDLGLLLDRLVHGDLAGFVDGPTSDTVDLDADVVTWDLSEVASTHPDVVPVLMAASAALVLGSWTAPGKGWGVVVVDELWNAFRVPELGVVVQEVMKKARTLGVEFLGATQHLVDMLEGGSFVSDADIVVSFRQEPVNAQVFGRHLGFSDVEVDALQQLGAHQAVWKVPGEPARAVQHVLHGCEQRIADTSQRLV